MLALAKYILAIERFMEDAETPDELTTAGFMREMTIHDFDKLIRIEAIENMQNLNGIKHSTFDYNKWLKAN